ncbi:MAG: hypothetical protein PHS00_02305 [Candidatus Pacebacteria bacterium]|nr:hypothetical protein [Candidatus Paceibacterota bacterium]
MVVPRYMLKKASPEAKELMRSAFPSGKIKEKRVVGKLEVEIDKMIRVETVLENHFASKVC